MTGSVLRGVSISRNVVFAVVSAITISACAGSSTTPASTTGAPAAPSSVAPSVAASPSAAITVHVISVEPEDSPEGKAMAFFRDEVARLSNGSVTILPFSEFGDSDQDNIKEITSGHNDMAIVQARNWDELGVTSMQALETPFLITTDGLAAAATTGDVADQLMSGLPQSVRGLAMWPIDLRHPVSFGKPFLSPADLKGQNIRIVGSTITEDVIRALGGTPLRSGDVDDAQFGGAESAFDRAYSLPQPGTFTGNVTFYPRVDVFFINERIFASLSPEQQAAVRSAAAATSQHVVDGIVPDADQAKTYCAEAGGSVALASEAQLAEFADALRPVAEAIERDPVTKDLIARIRAMPATPTNTAPIAAC
jgi:TRAP-type C4-dicarboxylate transport system substrate-binding protein